MERNVIKDVEYLNFVGLDQRMAYRWFPGGPAGPQGNGNNALQGAIRKMSALDDATISAKRDARLSAAGRVEQVAPQRAAATQEVATAAARMNGELRRIDTVRAALYALPALDPTDAVGAQVDAEIRARWGSFPPAQTEAIRADIAAGRNDRMLLALARDPIPTQGREWTLALWAERVKKQHSAKIGELDAAAADAEWALSALAALKNVLDRSATYGIGLEQGATV